MLSRLYGSLARRRRRWYARRPAARRRLDRPVVSVGALSVGGSGKTPITARLAALLAALGERPAVLSRGYARTRRVAGVVVVRDRDRVRAGLAEAGDEPLMLALALRDAAVLVAADRHRAGRLAETALGATVHLLDDGFQHLSLHRDVDLLLLAEQDLADPRTLPGGWLREPVDAARAADALIVETPDADAACALAARLGVGQAFRFRRVLQPPRHAETQQAVAVPPAAPVLAVAGIARPPRFFGALRAQGYNLAGHARVSRPPPVHRPRRRPHRAPRGRAAGGVRRHHGEGSHAAAAARPVRVSVALGAAGRADRARDVVPRVARRAPRAGAGRMRRRLEYAAVLALRAAVRALPRRASLGVGAALGRLFYRVHGRRRELALANLRGAFPTRAEGELRAILRSTFEHFGRHVVELLNFDAMSTGEMTRLVEVEGGARVEQALARGRGVVFYSGHIGYWELQVMVHAVLFAPVVMVARTLDNPLLDRLLGRIRTRGARACCRGGGRCAGCSGRCWTGRPSP